MLRRRNQGLGFDDGGRGCGAGPTLSVGARGKVNAERERGILECVLVLSACWDLARDVGQSFLFCGS